MNKKLLIIVAMTLLLSACSSKFAYNNLDWLVHWYLDDYIELTKEQEDLFDGYFSKWHQWHRSEELDKYVAQLKALKQDIEQDELNAESMASHLDSATTHWTRLINELAPELAVLAKNLDEEQVESLFASLEDENVKSEEKLLKNADLDEKEKLEKRQESLYDDLKERVGRLSKSQKAIVDSYSPKFVPTGLQNIEYRRRIQQAAKTLFENKDSNANFEQDLVYLLTHTDEFRGEKYIADSDHNRALYTAMMSDVLPTLSSKQKRKLIKQIQDMIEDFEDLSEA